MRLIEITKQHHKEFLQTLSVEEQQKDYEGMKAWHHQFKVHDVPPIDEAALPPKPQVYLVQSVDEFLRQGENKASATSEIQAKSAEETKNNDTAPKTISLSTGEFQGSNLSDKLIAMVFKFVGICLFYNYYSSYR